MSSNNERCAIEQMNLLKCLHRDSCLVSFHWRHSVRLAWCEVNFRRQKSSLGVISCVLHGQHSEIPEDEIPCLSVWTDDVNGKSLSTSVTKQQRLRRTDSSWSVCFPMGNECNQAPSFSYEIHCAFHIEHCYVYRILHGYFIKANVLSNVLWFVSIRNAPI